jgi:hypothetical protein
LSQRPVRSKLFVPALKSPKAPESRLQQCNTHELRHKHIRAPSPCLCFGCRGKNQFAESGDPRCHAHEGYIGSLLQPHQKATRTLRDLRLGSHTRCTRVRLHQPPTTSTLRVQLRSAPRLLVTRPHRLYVNLAVRREYSSLGRSGSTSTTPYAATTSSFGRTTTSTTHLD